MLKVLLFWRKHPLEIMELSLVSHWQYMLFTQTVGLLLMWVWLLKIYHNVWSLVAIKISPVKMQPTNYFFLCLSPFSCSVMFIFHNCYKKCFFTCACLVNRFTHLVKLLQVTLRSHFARETITECKIPPHVFGTVPKWNINLLSLTGSLVTLWEVGQILLAPLKTCLDHWRAKPCHSLWMSALPLVGAEDLLP